jgi:tRNA(adenine34) deaminase
MTFSDIQNNFMKAALREAQKAFEKDEIPIGAVVVHENKIIAKAYNQVELLKDSTAHAEMIAITSAESFLGSKYLNECDIYITAEPCAMCAGAILLSRLRCVYFGTYEPKFGAAGSILNLLDSGKFNYSPKVYSGLLEEESKYLMKIFFDKKRKNSF